jgi:hypothetical protein
VRVSIPGPAGDALVPWSPSTRAAPSGVSKRLLGPRAVSSTKSAARSLSSSTFWLGNQTSSRARPMRRRTFVAVSESVSRRSHP